MYVQIRLVCALAHWLSLTKLLQFRWHPGRVNTGNAFFTKKILKMQAGQTCNASFHGNVMDEDCQFPGLCRPSAQPLRVRVSTVRTNLATWSGRLLVTVPAAGKRG